MHCAGRVERKKARRYGLSKGIHGDAVARRERWSLAQRGGCGGCSRCRDVVGLSEFNRGGGDGAAAVLKIPERLGIIEMQLCCAVDPRGDPSNNIPTKLNLSVPGYQGGSGGKR